MTRLVISYVAASALALVACGKKDDKAGGGDKAADKPAAAPAPAIDVAAVNALVPAALKDKIVFEQRTVQEDRGRHPISFTLAAPKGWEQKMKMMATLRPPDSVDLGFMTEVAVASDCNGACEPKDWAAAAEKVLFEQYKTNGSKIERDDKGANDRTLVATTGDNPMDTRKHIVYAWWTPGAKSYHYCSVSLETKAMEAAPAFEKACKAVNVSGED